MTDRSNRSRLARAGVAIGLLVGSAAAVAARPHVASQTTPPTTAQTAPPQTPAPQPTAASPLVSPADSIARTPQDSMSAQGVPTLADSAQPSVTEKEPVAAAAAWPVDPATGLTLVNGLPVVGRVFVMQKVDGLRKYEGVKGHYVGEPLPPQAAVVGTSYRAPDLALTRRHRGMMVQSNLWSIEKQRSAMENHHYRPMVTPAQPARP